MRLPASEDPRGGLLLVDEQPGEVVDLEALPGVQHGPRRRGPPRRSRARGHGPSAAARRAAPRMRAVELPLGPVPVEPRPRPAPATRPARLAGSRLREARRAEAPRRRAARARRSAATSRGPRRAAGRARRSRCAPGRTARGPRKSGAGASTREPSSGGSQSRLGCGGPGTTTLRIALFLAAWSDVNGSVGFSGPMASSPLEEDTRRARSPAPDTWLPRRLAGTTSPVPVPGSPRVRFREGTLGCPSQVAGPAPAGRSGCRGEFTAGGRWRLGGSVSYRGP